MRWLGSYSAIFIETMKYMDLGHRLCQICEWLVPAFSDAKPHLVHLLIIRILMNTACFHTCGHGNMLYVVSSHMDTVRRLREEMRPWSKCICQCCGAANAQRSRAWYSFLVHVKRRNPAVRLATCQPCAAKVLAVLASTREGKETTCALRAEKE